MSEGTGCGVCGTVESLAVRNLDRLKKVDPLARLGPRLSGDCMGVGGHDAAQKSHNEEVTRLEMIVESQKEADMIRNKAAVLRCLLNDLESELIKKEEFVEFVTTARADWLSRARSAKYSNH